MRCAAPSRPSTLRRLLCAPVATGRKRRNLLCGDGVPRTRFVADGRQPRGRLRAVPAARLPAGPTDRRHVRSVAAHGLTALATGDARLVGGELVRAALRVGGPSTLARNFALLAGVHGGEAAVALLLIVLVVGAHHGSPRRLAPEGISQRPRHACITRALRKLA